MQSDTAVSYTLKLFVKFGHGNNIINKYIYKSSLQLYQVSLCYLTNNECEHADLQTYNCKLQAYSFLLNIFTGIIMSFTQNFSINAI